MSRLYWQSINRPTANELGALHAPAGYTPGRTPAIWVPGRGGYANELAPVGTLCRLPMELADRGLVCLGIDAGNNTGGHLSKWGADVTAARINSALSMLTTPLDSTGIAGSIAQYQMGCRTDRVILIARSGGTPTVLNWARIPANKPKVAAILIAIPATDLEWMRTNTAAYGTEMESVYGSAAAFQAARPTHNPIEYAATDLAGIPIRVCYMSDDASIDDGVATKTLAFAAAVGATVANGRLVNMGTGGHSTTPWIARAQVAADADWLAQYA